MIELSKPIFKEDFHMVSFDRFKDGKRYALTFSYDDGNNADKNLLDILTDHKMKGTFNLNSGLMETEFEWTHERGCVVKRLNVIVSLFSVN